MGPSTNTITNRTRSALATAGLTVALGGCQMATPAVTLGTPSGGFVLPPVTEAPAVPIAIDNRPSSPTGAGTGPGGEPTPKPVNHGSGSSGGGASGPAPGGPAFEGRVVGTTGTDEYPLPNATVTTSDGRTTTTDKDGRFRLADGPPVDGGLYAVAEGHVASAIAGLDGAAAVTLHLKARESLNTEVVPASAPVRAVGRVVGPDGAPRPNLLVVLEDARGAISAPVLTAEDGSFELRVLAPGGKVVKGTLLAVGGEGNAWMGMATNLSVTADTPDMDLDPTRAGNSPLIVKAATHPLVITLDASQAEGTPETTLEMSGPGATLSVPVKNGTAWVASVPGLSLTYSAEAINPTLGTISRVNVAPIAVDFAAPQTTLALTMLAPPELTTDTSFVKGDSFTWRAVAGADGYQVTLAGLDDQGFLWESYGTSTTGTYTYDQPLPPGNYGLTVTAWDATGLGVRQVASVGPRQLRVLPLGGTYRKASRQVRRSV